MRDIKTECNEMGVISCVETFRRMSVLILSAIFVCAAGAPSGVVAPVPLASVIPIAVPTATISPGDLQAAAIDANVKAEDEARAAVDRARELAHQALENQNEKIDEINDQVKEQNQEVFWSVQDKQWQALDSIKTAEAQIDGSIASNAEALARSVVNGVFIPYSSISAPVGIPVLPVSPVVYTQGIVAPATKTVVAEANNEQGKVEAAKVEDTKKEATLVKTADIGDKAAEMRPDQAVKSQQILGLSNLGNTVLVGPQKLAQLGLANLGTFPADAQKPAEANLGSVQGSTLIGSQIIPEYGLAAPLSAQKISDLMKIGSTGLVGSQKITELSTANLVGSPLVGPIRLAQPGVSILVPGYNPNLQHLQGQILTSTFV